jgi:DNA-binding NtrC family response regulator
MMNPDEFKLPDAPSRERSLPLLVREYERRLITGALAATRGCQKHAAEALGVLPTTLSMKMKRLGLRPGASPAERY